MISVHQWNVLVAEVGYLKMAKSSSFCESAQKSYNRMLFILLDAQWQLLHQLLATASTESFSSNKAGNFFCFVLDVCKNGKGTDLSSAHSLLRINSCQNATLLRTAASSQAAAFDPHGLLLWCAIPECLSQCSKLTEGWKEAKSVYCNHLCSSIPLPRGPCKVTVFISSPMPPFLARQSHRWLFPQAGPMYKREVKEGSPSCILHSSLAHSFSASRFIVNCVFQVLHWWGVRRDRRQGLFVFLFVCVRLQRPVMCGDIAVTQRPHRRCRGVIRHVFCTSLQPLLHVPQSFWSFFVECHINVSVTYLFQPSLPFFFFFFVRSAPAFSGWWRKTFVLHFLQCL